MDTTVTHTVSFTPHIYPDYQQEHGAALTGSTVTHCCCELHANMQIFTMFTV